MITVDMKKIYNVNGISMLPRQDGSQNGYIAQHQVFLSKDKKNWGSPVAYGTWYADWTTKYANFDTQPARYVRLFTITEANGNPWTSIAELNDFQANDYVPPQSSSLGAWGPTINFPVIPVAGTVDPNTGKALIWSSWARDTTDGGPGGLTLTSTWDPATDLVSEREVTETNHILTNGGTPDYQDSDATSDAHIITIGSPGTKAAVSYASEGLFHARVFHTSVVLPNGNVVITGGQQYATPFADTTPVLEPEMYLPDEDRFVLMKPSNIVRTCHSIALLLPDVRVFNGGGGLCGGCDTNHFDAQLYSPPYLYDSKGKLATRPKIISVSASAVKVGGTISVQRNGAIAQASLVRNGTAIYTVNSDQRRVPLVLANAGKNTYSF